MVHEIYGQVRRARRAPGGRRCRPRRRTTPWPIDYFVWLLRSTEGDIVVDVGFSAATARKRGRTHLRSPPRR
ncbi:MAG: hypothetical protein R2749_32220 [Acidimicrobiales bacterium]